MNLLTQANLYDRTRQDESFQKLLSLFHADNSAPINVFGLTNCAKALFALLLAEEQAELEEKNAGVCLQNKEQFLENAPGKRKKKPILYVAPDALRARSIAEDFRALTGKVCPILYPEVSDLLASGVKSRHQEIRRWEHLNAFLRGEYEILLISGSVLLEKLPLPQFFIEGRIELQRGQEYSYEILLDKLEKLGYSRVREVDSFGQFSVRGEIIDIGIFSNEEEEEALGIRLNFFDRELESIKFFDLGTQRSTEALANVSLAPIKERLLTRQERQILGERMCAYRERAIQEAVRHSATRAEIAHMKAWMDADIEAFEGDLPFAGKSRWNFLFKEKKSSILDYARIMDATLILEEPKLLRERLDAGQAEFREEIKSLLEKYSVPKEAIDNKFTASEAFTHIHEAELKKLAFANLASSGNGFPQGNKCSFHILDAENYRAREGELFQRIRGWQKEGWRILLAVPDERPRKRLRELLLEQSLTLPIYDSAIKEGFVWPAAKIALLGSQNLLGRVKERSRRKRHDGIAIDFFGDLKPGEYVVHDLHGIGKYLGLTTLTHGKSSRDYLHIAYAGEDKLYIPVDQLDEIQRYIATDGKKPKASRLGSKEWERKKEKVRESVRKLAVDLVEVYSKRSMQKGFSFLEDTVWQREFEDSFPYIETDDQIRAIEEIKADMESDKIMERLLCGDVGFGKTEIAFRAIFKVVMSGKQAAMIVPTTVLAQQHFTSFKERIAGFPLRVRLLSRFTSEAERKSCMKELANGACDVVIGTHSVLNKKISFHDLGLLVIDEEQRFGVEHKELIKERYPGIDVLVLTATPIPRTLHMAVSGVRDISLLREGPANRRPIQTYVMEYQEDIIDEAILREISRQGQVFYVLNNIKKLPGKMQELEERLPGAKIRMAHGRMAEKQIEETIRDFVEQRFDVLLSTTIIESGIDMPRVNTLIVEHAEKMGLAQLYQLRGRVGRSDRQAYAYISYPGDVVLKEDAQKRLTAIRDFTELGSGLSIAMRDLEVRGAGTFLGAEQSGHLGAVGYDLYARLLEESIQEVKGIEQEVKPRQTIIDLDIDARIPQSYIQDEGQRMEVYKRILFLQNQEDWHDIVDELLDRFGEPPKATMNLIDISFVRVEAGRAGVEKIEQKGNNIILKLLDEDIDRERIFSLFQNEKYTKMLRFNAGQAPHLLLVNGAQNQDLIAESLRKLWMK